MLGKHNLVSSLLKELGARGDAKSSLVAKPKQAEVLSPEEEAKRLARREKLIRELVETEKSYISQLVALDECYMTPLLREAAKPEPPIPIKMCDVLFLNVRSIKSMNESTLLVALEKAQASPNQCIGAALVDFAPFFQLYKDYIANHVKANDLLEQLNAEDSPHVKFKAFCSAALTDPKTRGLNLGSLLITPIQRVPRYKLFLDEIRKNTPPNHPDTAPLDKAYALVAQAAIDINEAVRSQENRTFLMDMQENMFTTKMTLVKPGPMSADRVFIRKGLLMKVCRSSDKPFTFFLFSNMLMYGTEVRMNLKEKYKISHQLPIDGQFKVERNDDASTKAAVPPPKHSWRIVNNVKSFIVYARDGEEMESWYKDLQKCVAVLRAEAKAGNDSTGVRPIWAPDKDSKACTLCHNDFTLLNRRHHCRKCGTLCCGDCSKARIDIKVVLNPGTPPPALKKGEKVDKVRVCITCVGIVRSLGGDVPIGIEGKIVEDKKTNASAGGEDHDDIGSPKFTRVPTGSIADGERPRIGGMGTLKMDELSRALSVRQSGGMSLNIKAIRKCTIAGCNNQPLERQANCRQHTTATLSQSTFDTPAINNIHNNNMNGSHGSSNGTTTGDSPIVEHGDVDIDAMRSVSGSMARRPPPPPPRLTTSGPPPLPNTSTQAATPTSATSPSSASAPPTPSSAAAKRSGPPPPKRPMTLTGAISPVPSPSSPLAISAAVSTTPASPTSGVTGSPPSGATLASPPPVAAAPVSPTPPARPSFKPLFAAANLNNGNAAWSPHTPTASSSPVTPSTPVATSISPAASPTSQTSAATITVAPSIGASARTPSKVAAKVPPPPLPASTSVSATPSSPVGGEVPHRPLPLPPHMRTLSKLDTAPTNGTTATGAIGNGPSTVTTDDGTTKIDSSDNHMNGNGTATSSTPSTTSVSRASTKLPPPPPPRASVAMNVNLDTSASTTLASPVSATMVPRPSSAKVVPPPPPPKPK